MHQASREEFLRLLPSVELPGCVAKPLYEAGVMRALEDYEEDGVLTGYEVDPNAFTVVPDRVLAVLYSELKRFGIWYEERERYLKSDAEAAEKRQDHGLMLYQSTKPLIAESEEMLAKEAQRFVRIFVNQWNRYR